MPKGMAACVPPTFPNIGNALQIVGRTPWSARVPLDPLLANRIRVVPAGDQGSAPRLVQIVRSYASSRNPSSESSSCFMPTRHWASPDMSRVDRDAVVYYDT